MFRQFCAGFRQPVPLVQNCKSQVASGLFVVRNGLQDGLLWPLWELKLHKLRWVAEPLCTGIAPGTKLQITSSIWTFCGQKWAPRRAPLATLAGQVALERLLVQNHKSPLASGRFVVRNGLQDGLLWPLLVVYFRWFALVPASPVHVNGSWCKTANHQ